MCLKRNWCNSERDDVTDSFKIIHNDYDNSLNVLSSSGNSKNQRNPTTQNLREHSSYRSRNFLKRVNSYLFWSYLTAACLIKGMSFMEVVYPLKNLVACPTAPGRLESWKTIQPKRIQRKKLFPLSFLGLANS